MKGRSVVFDAEADGLLEQATRIWCIAACDLYSDDEWFWGPDEIEDGLKALSEAKMIVGHNIINYDIPLFKKFYPNWTYQGCKDTLVLSRLFYPDRKIESVPEGYPASVKNRPHSIEAWGIRLGKKKPDHEDWSQFSEDMKIRCQEDTRITKGVYFTLKEETGSWDWKLASKIEHQIAEISSKQERVGFVFDMGLAQKVTAEITTEIESLDEVIQKYIYHKPKRHGAEVKKPFKKSGEPSKMCLDWGIENPGGPFSRVKWELPNLGSRQQLMGILIEHGWKPDSYTDKGNPQITESSLEAMGNELGTCLARRFVLKHKLSQITGLIENTRPNNRIPSVVNPCATNTCRMTHKVIANIPSSEAVYGEEMRSLFCVPEGQKLVGWDMANLEARILAHFMDDSEFTEAILRGKKEEGTDIHSMNQKKTGIDSRTIVKNTLYGLLYGAGDYKLGEQVIDYGTRNEKAAKGKELRSALMEAMPKLKVLIERVQAASQRGYIKALDGRKIWMRRDDSGKVMTHKALNTLIQGNAAVLMKTATIISDQKAEKNHVDATILGQFHDEVQAGVAISHIDSYTELVHESVNEVNEFYNIRCPLEAECLVGDNWSHTH